MSIEILLVIRLVKMIGVLALASGTVGAFVPRALEDRKRAAYFLAAPGLAVTWGAGLALALGMHYSPVVPWIAIAAVSSTISANVVLHAVAREGRRSVPAASLAIAGVLVALALMVLRPGLS